MSIINCIHFVTSVDEEHGEGMISKIENFPEENVRAYVPFLCINEAGLDHFKKEAKQFSEKSKQKVKIIKLSLREELEEFDGRQLN